MSARPSIVTYLNIGELQSLQRVLETLLPVAEGPAVWGPGDHRDEAVNVGPEVELDEVAVGEAGVGLRQERHEVTQMQVGKEIRYLNNNTTIKS